VRWVRRDGSAVEPAAFLPVAERSSLITELDLAVLEQSLLTLRGLPGELTVAVNVAAQSLSSPSYVERALALIEAADLPTHRLHLEVTETRCAAPWTASPRPESAGSWTTSAPGTRRSRTCATCRSRA
jgi:EAL domain-containing protein (putative c-di-GMP-specific phosphodiesterase class I)